MTATTKLTKDATKLTKKIYHRDTETQSFSASHVGRQGRPTVRADERTKTQTVTGPRVCVFARSRARAALVGAPR